MRHIAIDDETFRVIHLSAQVSGVSETELVRRIVLGIAPSNNSDAGKSRGPDGIAVRGPYKGHEARAIFDPERKSIRMTGNSDPLLSPLEGKVYESPSAAAIAVVQAINPSRRRPETNGKKFWREAGSDRDIAQRYRRG
jgi:hypothetical protein